MVELFVGQRDLEMPEPSVGGADKHVDNQLRVRQHDAQVLQGVKGNPLLKDKSSSNQNFENKIENYLNMDYKLLYLGASQHAWKKVDNEYNEIIKKLANNKLLFEKLNKEEKLNRLCQKLYKLKGYNIDKNNIEEINTKIDNSKIGYCGFSFFYFPEESRLFNRAVNNKTDYFFLPRLLSISMTYLTTLSFPAFRVE